MNRKQTDDAVREILEKAVAAERERCARIAEALISDYDWNNNPGQAANDTACELIATRIRSVE